MAKKIPAPATPVGPPPEAFEGLDEWAAAVAAAISPAELESLAASYRKIARDPRVSDLDRRLARKQAKALAQNRR